MVMLMLSEWSTTRAANTMVMLKLSGWTTRMANTMVMLMLIISMPIRSMNGISRRRTPFVVSLEGS